VNVLELPRYQSNPTYLFFETYVLDVIGALPDDTRIRSDDVARVFGEDSGGWREALQSALRLSSTIEVAILDHWYRHAASYGDYEPQFVPFAFAQDFVDRYFEEGSTVDVWGEGELEAARSRVASATAQADISA